MLARVMAATFDAGGLDLTGIIAREALRFTWWSWYIGDALGAFGIAPLAMCLLFGYERIWRERWRNLVLPMPITLGLAGLHVGVASHWEREDCAVELAADGETLASRIADRFVAHRQILIALQSFIEAAPALSHDQIERFTRATLRANPDILGLSVNALVDGRDRAADELRMSAISPLGPFRITEHGAQGRIVPAATRPQYVAIQRT